MFQWTLMMTASSRRVDIHLLHGVVGQIYFMSRYSRRYVELNFSACVFEWLERKRLLWRVENLLRRSEFRTLANPTLFFTGKN